MLKLCFCLSATLAASSCFDKLCFYIFQVNSHYIIIPSETPSLAHGLFRSILANFQVSDKFLIIFLLFISSLILLY